MIGCDEVGRGPLAGPAVIGLVVWEPHQTQWPEGLRDSKAISEKKRPGIAEAIRETFTYCAIGESSPQEIDDGGIVKALATAVVRGLRGLAAQGVSVGSSVLLLDGSHDFVTPHLPLLLTWLLYISDAAAHLPFLTHSCRWLRKKQYTFQL